MDNGLDLSSFGVEISDENYLAPYTPMLLAGAEISESVEISSAPYLSPSTLILTPGVEFTNSVEEGIWKIFQGVTILRKMVKLHLFARPMEDGDNGFVIDIGYYADFAGTPRVIDEDEEVSFRDGTYGPEIETWLWNFGDGQTGSGRNPKHVYADPGNYTVRMEAWSVDNEYANIVKPFYITVLDVPDPEEEEGGGYMLNAFIDDISYRIRNPKGEKWQHYPHILRVLNRLYHRLCRDYRLVQKPLVMDFSTLSTFVNYWSLPGDYINLYHIDDDYTWVDPTEFDETEIGRYTITRGRIYFSGIDATTVITMLYYSSGNTLTTKATESLEATECNLPEWTDRALDQVLYYGACIELKDDYPGRAADVDIYNRLEIQLKDAFGNVQDKDFETPSDPPATGSIDAYDFGD